MFEIASTTIEQLLDSLGFTLLRAVDNGADLAARVASVCFFDPLEPSPIDADTLLLGAGLSTAESAAEMIMAGSTAGAAGVVLRDRLTTEDAVRDAARRTGLPVLDLVRGGSWLQLASMIESRLLSDVGDHGFGAASADLFELANTIAGLVGGPVTIEDLSSRVLAYSADQQRADHARQQTVLGHQVPAGYSERLASDGAFAQIYGSPTPIFLEALAPDLLPRVAIRLAAGGEIVGSIWVVTEGPLSEQQQLGLTEAAGVVALSIMRSRMSTDSERRLRAAEVITMLEGGPEAQQAAARSGFGSGPACVLAFGTAGSAGVRERLDRLASSLQMYLAAVHPSVRAAVVGDVVYAVAPMARDRGEQEAVQLAEAFIRRSANLASTPLVGIGSVVSDVESLRRSRQEADATLRVLVEEGESRTRCLATAAQVQSAILLIKVRDHLADSPELTGGPLSALISYDEAHDAGLVETLRTWLESFGDVNGAAAALHIHKNTFRYRLRRLSEIAGLDLADPDTRLGLMLQLRMTS